MSPRPGGARSVLLVGDPASRTTLSGARALGRAGWAVHVAGAPGRGLVGWSRCVTGRHVVAPPTDTEAFADDLVALAETLPGAVVLACGDAELLALARTAERLGSLKGVPRTAAVEALVDKGLLAEGAARAGLATPQVLVGEPSRWPVVAKAAVHSAPGRADPRWEVVVAASAVELAAARDRAHAAGVELIVQEHVSGQLIALALVLDGTGTVVGRAQQVAERIWPRGAGVSARAVTVPVDDGLAERAATLLRNAGWTGLAQLQLLTRPGREPVLIDVNPRLYGSLRLAVAAGAPLPDLTARVLAGEQVARRPDARAGVRYQWLLGDLRAALSEPARTPAVLGVLRAAGRSSGAVRDGRDLLPVAACAADLAARAIRPKGLRTVSPRSR